MLLSPGGEEMEEGDEEPQEEEPELLEETELVLCLPPVGGMPWASLLFTAVWQESSQIDLDNILEHHNSSLLLSEP